eukprot:scaffold98607_cov29-Prasinocladus_malaysianus.AAC.2
MQELHGKSAYGVTQTFVCNNASVASARCCRLEQGVFKEVPLEEMARQASLLNLSDVLILGVICRPPNLHELRHEEERAWLEAGAVKLHDVAVVQAPQDLHLLQEQIHLRLARVVALQGARPNHRLTIRQGNNKASGQRRGQDGKINRKSTFTVRNQEGRTHIGKETK